VEVAAARGPVLRGEPRELVGTLVERVADVAADPPEAHGPGALGDDAVDRLDELEVLHGLPAGGAPPLALPRDDPLGRALDRVLRVGLDEERFRAGVRADRLEQRGELGDLVGPARGAAGVERAVVVDPRPPDGAARVAQARAVGADSDHSAPRSRTSPPAGCGAGKRMRRGTLSPERGRRGARVPTPGPSCGARARRPADAGGRRPSSDPMKRPAFWGTGLTLSQKSATVVEHTSDESRVRGVGRASSPTDRGT